jgi:hypothetical protein
VRLVIGSRRTSEPAEDILRERLNITTVSRSLWLACVIIFLGLDLLGAEAMGKAVQAVGLWLGATGLFYGCGAMVLWPRQLVASNAGNLGTRRPEVARGFGAFGLVIAVLFETLASAWSGHFHWPTFVMACAASGLCAAAALRNLGSKLKASAGRRSPGPTWTRSSSHQKLS